jgi:hypothetical protein
MRFEKYTKVWLENMKTRIRDKSAGGSIILEMDLKNTEFRLNSVETYLLPIVGSCEHGNTFLMLHNNRRGISERAEQLSVSDSAPGSSMKLRKYVTNEHTQIRNILVM